MKKNRPGVLLTVLCAESRADNFSEMILRETSAFGVRRTMAERRKLRREFSEVKTPFGKITVKLGRFNEKVVQASPEFESCKKLASRAKVPLKRSMKRQTGPFWRRDNPVYFTCVKAHELLNYGL